MAHVPKEVLAKNFRVNASAFDHIPDRELYMIPSAVPDMTPAQENVVSPAGTVPLPFTFAASKAPVQNVRFFFCLIDECADPGCYQVTGGSVKIVDSRTFNISQTIAMAEVTVVPGGIRELHVSEVYIGFRAER